MQLLPYNQCRELERTHVCAECNSPLVTVWVGMENHYGVACGQTHSHEGFQREMSYTERYKAGMPIPLEVEIQFQRKEAAIMEKENDKAKTPMLALLPREDVGDRKALTRDQVTTLLEVSHALMIDPYMGHIVIYYGRPYVTEAGMLYHAHRSGELDGMQSRPMTPSERQDAMIPEDEHAWQAWVYRKGYEYPFGGLGRAREDEKRPIAKGSFVEHLHPHRMAEKRAEMQALRKAFPIGLPILGAEEEAGEGEGSATETKGKEEHKIFPPCHEEGV